MSDDWVREYPEDNGKMVQEFEDEDFCEKHGCWKPYCKDDSHNEEDDDGKA